MGFDKLVEHVRPMTPEWAAEITGVPADIIRALARRIARAHGASPVMYSGLEYSDSGVQAIRATMVLWALAGQLDVPGGRCFTMPANTALAMRKTPALPSLSTRPRKPRTGPLNSPQA